MTARMEAAIGGGFHEHAEAATVFLTGAYVLVDEGIEALRAAAGLQRGGSRPRSDAAVARNADEVAAKAQAVVQRGAKA